MVEFLAKFRRTSPERLLEELNADLTINEITVNIAGQTIKFKRSEYLSLTKLGVAVSSIVSRVYVSEAVFYIDLMKEETLATQAALRRIVDALDPDLRRLEDQIPNVQVDVAIVASKALDAFQVFRTRCIEAIRHIDGAIEFDRGLFDSSESIAKYSTCDAVANLRVAVSPWVGFLISLMPDGGTKKDTVRNFRRALDQMTTEQRKDAEIDIFVT